MQNDATDLELDTDEHDPFGGATPVGDDQAVAWTPQRPSRRPSWFWIGTAVLAVGLGTGAFVGMRAAANNTTATNTAPANGVPPGAYGPPGFGGPRGGGGGGGGPRGGGPGFGPPPDQQQPQQQKQPQQNVTTQ